MNSVQANRKVYKQDSKLKRLISVLLIFVCFCTFFAVTGAWFTDTDMTEISSILTFGSVKLEVTNAPTNGIKYKATASVIRKLGGETRELNNVTTILPGDKICVLMYVKNVGSVASYYLANVSSTSSYIDSGFSGDYYYSASASTMLGSVKQAVQTSSGTKGVGHLTVNEQQPIKVMAQVKNGISGAVDENIRISIAISAIQAVNITTTEAYDNLKSWNNDFASAYTQVEYIESTGTQWIDTGYETNSTNIAFELGINYPTVPTSEGCVLGNGTPGIELYAKGGNYFGFWTRNGGSLTTPISANTWYDVKASFNSETKSLYLNNSLVGSNATGSLTLGGSIWLFKYNNTDYSSSNKLSYCKIFDNDTLVRDFVPCYRNSDFKPGLYDKVNNVFYTNQGTGEFGIGYDYSNNFTPVEYIESSGTQWINTGVKGGK